MEYLLRHCSVQRVFFLFDAGLEFEKFRARLAWHPMMAKSEPEITAETTKADLVKWHAKNGDGKVVRR